jgi:hypothetical protein
MTSVYIITDILGLGNLAVGVVSGVPKVVAVAIAVVVTATSSTLLRHFAFVVAGATPIHSLDRR